MAMPENLFLYVVLQHSTINFHLIVREFCVGTSLVIQWVRLRAPNAGGRGWIPGRGTRSRMYATTKIPRAATKTRCSQNKLIN